jgi:hypothetical protein
VHIPQQSLQRAVDLGLVGAGVQGISIKEHYEGVGEDRRLVGRTMVLKLGDGVKRLELLARHFDVQAFRDVTPPSPMNGLGERLMRMERAAREYERDQIAEGSMIDVSSSNDEGSDEEG